MSSQKKTSSWGNYPTINHSPHYFSNDSEISAEKFIPRGNARSYGDSSLSETMIDMRKHNLMLDFENENGVLHCQSGVLLSEIIEVFLPRGWFPLVTPGTKFITIGGAIASDVHGKNHHTTGSFSECVIEFSLLLPEGKILKCSKEIHSDFYQATLGGMGLTGIILDAKIQLQKVESQFIDQHTIKTNNLRDTFDQFEKFIGSSYSVAWIDCLAKNNVLGRGIFTAGEHAQDKNFSYQSKKKLPFPFHAPSFCINQLTIKAFNTLYYHRISKRESYQKVSIDQFFYPLDGIENWNRAYGKQGFLQYQFVLPTENSYQGMQEVLQEIAQAGTGSILTVLKLMGEANNNLLSFPRKGYTFAIDFKNNQKNINLLKRLDDIVINHGGRFYLAKDARVSKEVFDKGYPNVEQFRAFRKEHQLNNHLSSLQSQRLKL